MRKNTYSLVWSSLIAVLLVLLFSAWHLYDSRFQQELSRTISDTDNELSLISVFVHERLQNRNYQLAKNFIINWGENSPDVVKIILVTKNGFELARYNQRLEANHELSKEVNIQYSYNSQATLRLTKNLDLIYLHQQYLLYQLLVGYFFVAAVLSFLVYTNLKIHKQKQNLRSENTLRKQAEELLRDRERNLSITLNSIGDAVVVTDAQGHVTRLNPVAEKLTGWSQQEASGKKLDSIFPIVDASTRQPIKNPVEKVIATGKTIFLSNHTTLVSKDGTEYQIADSAAPIRDKGEIIGMILVFNDVTKQYQLRQSAEKNKRDLQAIMDHSPTMICVKSIDGKISFINHQFEKIHNITRSDIIGKTASQVFSTDIANIIQRNDKAILETGSTMEHEENFIQDDTPHSYITTKFPLLNEDGKIYALCGISTDITEHRNQEERLRRSQKMDALGKLTGGIAHDYNNLLGIIQGYAEQIGDHVKHDVMLSKYAHDIQHAAERGAKLTKKLLAFTRLKPSEAAVTDINQLLLDQRLMLEKMLTARIKLLYTTEDNLWPVNVDIGDLEDAIVNISINAMHAMEAGGQLTFRTSNESLTFLDAQQFNLPEGDYTLLSITDNGTGMDVATREKIFDPFYSTKGENGTGLGLSQVYGFVERSGGFVKVYSELGHGTRFAIYFPRSHHVLNNTETPSIATSRNLGGSETILVVDDEYAMLDLAHDILTNKGYRVLTANDGIEALKVLEKEPVDLILSDVIMPNMDGYQLAAKVQKRYPSIKMQMVSGFTDNRHKHLTNDSLYKNTLHKPYTSRTLLERVRSRLDSFISNKNINATSSTNKTIMVMDDDENIRNLFQINLVKMGHNMIHACNGDEAIDIYQQFLANNNPIDVVILDLSIHDGLGGKDTAQKILSLDQDAILIVSSGNPSSPEMMHYQNYGFRGALEKSFNYKTLKRQIDKILALNQLH